MSTAIEGVAAEGEEVSAVAEENKEEPRSGGEDLITKIIRTTVKPKPRPVSEKYVCLLSSKVHFYITRDTPDIREIYMVDLLNNNNKTKHKKPIPQTTLNPLWQGVRPFSSRDGNFCASLGSTVYSLGGSPDYYGGRKEKSKEVYMFDTNRPDEGFKQGPPMITARYSGHAVPLGGKIYVFGGTNQEPCAECYDPNKGIWKSLSESPMNLDGVIAIPLGEVHIMVAPRYNYKAKKVFMYNVESDTWQSLPREISLSWSDVVLAGNSLYWFKPRQYEKDRIISAYDLESDTYYSCPIKGLVLGDRCINYGMFHLSGNEFCCIMLDDSIPRDYRGKPAIVYCSRFRVVRRTCGTLDASVVSCHSYLVDHKIRIGDAVLLEDEMFAGMKKQGKGRGKHG